MQRPSSHPPRRATRLAAALTVAAALTAHALPSAAQPPTAPPAASPAPQAARVVLGFHDAPLREVAQLYANLLGRGFAFRSEADASARITLTHPKPLPAPEAYRAFLVALDARGFTVVPKDGLLRIVRVSHPPATPAKPPTRSGAVFNTPRNGLQTHFVPIQHAPLGPLRDTLAQVAAGSAQVLTDPRADRLIIIGPPAQARRLRALIRQLDRPGTRARVHIYTPQHQRPEALADALKTLAQ